jgi:hypothetical protein
MTSRKAMLGNWREDDHPGIVFLNEIATEHRVDGSIEVDTRKCIVLPERQDDWTEQHCNDAYRILAHVDESDVGSASICGLKCQYIERHELLAIAAKWEEEPVPFWRQFKPSKRINQLMRIARLVSWFQCKIDAGEPPIRLKLVTVAKEEFSLAEAVADRVWLEYAPDYLRSPGRRPGSQKRH